VGRLLPLDSPASQLLIERLRKIEPNPSALLPYEFNAVDGSASDQRIRYSGVAWCAFFGVVGVSLGLCLLCRRSAQSNSAPATTDWSFHPLPNGCAERRPDPELTPFRLSAGAQEPAAPAIVQQVDQPGRRSGFVRTIFAVLWAIAFFLVTGVVAAMIATHGAGDDPELSKQLAQQSGETVGPWLMLGSIATSAVLGTLGVLPGTRRVKQ
jgi:hypothetical protein